MEKRFRVRWLALFALASSLSALTGCGAQARASKSGVSSPIVESPSQTVSSSTPSAVTGTFDGTPAPTTGWTMYLDPRFGFRIPIPPGWQPASGVWPPQTDPNGFNYYIVQFFPPGPHGDPGPAASAYAPELIQITVTLSGPYSTSLAQNSGWVAEPGAVALGNTQVKIYYRGDPGDGGEILRSVETTLGRYPIDFDMKYSAYGGGWDPAVAQRDVGLFLGMLKGFQYPVT